MQRAPIYKRQFWRDFRIDILRFRKDPRARKSVRLKIGFFAYLIGAVCYYGHFFYSFHDPATAIGLGFALFMMFAIFAANWYSQKREAHKNLEADFASVPAEVTAHVQRLAHGLAAITERALGERWLIRNTVPEGHTVITRRITIDALKQFGVWDEMPSPAREWVMRPDGSWPLDRVARVLATGELLNTLLWALGLQNCLRPTDELLTPLSMKKLASVLKRPAPGIRPTWDLRVERNRAIEYYGRCYAEQVHRNEVVPENDEHEAALRAWMEEISENPHEDVLAGALTVRELEQPAVWQATLSSAYRGHVLSLLMSLLDGEDTWIDLTNTVYACLLGGREEAA